MAWPAQPDPWLTDYCVWRINSGKLATRPATVPTNVPGYADEYLYWAIWRRQGRPSLGRPAPSS